MLLELQLAVELPGGLVTAQMAEPRVSDSVCLGWARESAFPTDCWMFPGNADTADLETTLREA